MNIEILETSSNYFTVIVDENFADHLTQGEVLEVIASTLFADKPVYVQSYTEWTVWHERYGHPRPKKPVALLPMKIPPRSSKLKIEYVLGTRYSEEPPRKPLVLNGIVYATWLNVETGKKLKWNGKAWVE